MPLPLVPVAAVALTAWAARRALRAKGATGRRDQRMEDALDDLPDGLTRQSSPTEATQRGTARLKRRVRIGSREWDLDASLVARVQLKKVSQE